MAGFPARQIIVWQRSGSINFNPGYFLPTYEAICLIAKPGFGLKRGASRMGGAWKIVQAHGSAHPPPPPPFP